MGHVEGEGEEEEDPDAEDCIVESPEPESGEQKIQSPEGEDEDEDADTLEEAESVAEDVPGPVFFLDCLQPQPREPKMDLMIKGPFHQHGMRQLEEWTAKALQALDVSTRADMMEYLSLPACSVMQIGTACSGSDAPVLVAKAFASSVKSIWGIEMQLQHSFSCECDQGKQLFLKHLFQNTHDGVQIEKLFTDTQQLRCGPLGEAHDVLSDAEKNVPPCSEMFMGFPCQDVSKLNIAAGDNRFVVRDGQLRTGRVFQDVMRYIKKLQSFPEKESHDPPGPFFSGMILENVLGLLDRPKGADPSTGQPYHNNLEYVDQALRNVGLYMVPMILDPHLFGQPVSRKRVWMLCFQRSAMEAAGVSEADVQAMTINIMESMCCFPIRDIDDFLLPEDDEHVQEELRRAQDIDIKRMHDSARSKTRSGKRKWAETHVNALLKQGDAEWWQIRAPDEATLQRLPGLHALTDRQLDLCNLLRISFPDRRKSVVDLSQGFRTARTIKGNHSDLITPQGQHFLTHRGRMLTGVEALCMQAIHFGADQHRVLDFTPQLLRSLAGNAFNVFCCSACLITKKAVEAKLHMKAVVRSKASAASASGAGFAAATPQRQNTLDDLCHFAD